jgi:hypothetical protein
MSRANANGIPYEWRWPPLPVGFPRRGFSHPFQAPWPNRGGSEAAKEHPRTVSGSSLPRPLVCQHFFHQILELRMCALSHRIREIPRWWEEMRIAERWREDVLEQVENDVDGQQSWKLTPRMVCLAPWLMVIPTVLNSISEGRLCARGAQGIRRSA